MLTFNAGGFYEKKFQVWRKKYLLFCKLANESLKDLYNLDIFLLFKLNDDWIIDVIKSIRMLNKPIIVQDREHGIIPQRMKLYPAYLKKIFEDLEVDMLFLTNQSHLEFFKRCGFNNNKLKILGRPDSDSWFHKPDKNFIKQYNNDYRNKIVIVFFAFGLFNYLNFFYKGEKRNWAYLAEDFHNVLLRLANDYGDKIHIIYKVGGKPLRDNFPGFEKFFNSLKSENKVNLLTILPGAADTKDLLKMSDIVVGFHTLGLIEAMFTKQPIFYGAWGEFFNDIKQTLLPFHNLKGLHHCKSRNELYEKISYVIENFENYTITSDMIKFRRIEREEMYYKPDGNSSRRIVEALSIYEKK